MESSSNSNKGIPDISKNNEEILQNIQLLQNSEQELMRDLENNPKLSSQQQQKIIQKIQMLTDIRTGLYTTLSGMQSFYQSALSSSTGTLKEQTAAINIVENELNRAKQRLNYLEMEKNNKIRLVEINQYYGDKYAEHTNLMKIVIFTLIPIIILTILFNKSILPSRVYYILFIIVGIIGAINFWSTYASIITRDNMNYNEYNFPFDPNTAPKSNGKENEDPWGTLMVGTCVGEACCQEDQTYDFNLNQCVSGSTTTTKESFEMKTSTKTMDDNLYNGLTKTQSYKHKADADLKESYTAYNS
jgi:hypothetical protein